MFVSNALYQPLTTGSTQVDPSCVLPRPRSRENIAVISAKSRQKHPSCESCRKGIFQNSQSKLSVFIVLKFAYFKSIVKSQSELGV